MIKLHKIQPNITNKKLLGQQHRIVKTDYKYTEENLYDSLFTTKRLKNEKAAFRKLNLK